jgi:glycosyltransferase involved in cell wall biosynthesis
MPESDKMNKLRVLHLIHHFSDPGIGAYVRMWMQHFDKQSYRWYVGALSSHGDLQEEFRRLGASVVDFSKRRTGSKILIKRIRDYVVTHQISIVHSQSVRTTLAAALALVGTRQTAHLATEQLFYSPWDRRFGTAYTLLDRFSLYLPDHIVALSQRMYDQIISLPCLNPKGITVIRNAIDCEACFTPNERYPRRSEFGLTPESQVIGYTGRLEKQKRLDLLLEGFSQVLSQHSQARLMIVGKGWLRPSLEDLAVRLGISHAVIWTGFRKDIPSLLAAMDIYVQPSANEGLSHSILESMAAGKPVIVTDVGGAQEVVTNGRTGILIPQGSASAIGSAIIDLLDHPEKRTALGQAARSRVVDEFSVQRLVDAYQDLYQALALKV